MPAKDIGIDLGTRNSLVFSTGKGIVLREPSVVVYDKDTEKIRAIGEEARQMASHLTSNMEVIWPIRRGVIVDYNVMEKMLKYFISQAMGRRAFRKPRSQHQVFRVGSRGLSVKQLRKRLSVRSQGSFSCGRAHRCCYRCRCRYHQAIW